MRRHISWALALAFTGSMTATLPSAGHPADPGAPGAGCEVTVMAWPDEADDGTVMDIEVVPGLGTVYYGSYRVPDATWGMPRRAVVWYGADAQPVQVGPAGSAYDIAYELTSSGKINGISLMDGSDFFLPWVQDLRTGRLTWIDGGGAEDFGVRRINDRGEAVGTVYGPDGATAMVWWPRVDRPGRPLHAGELGWSEALAVNNHRMVAGSFAHDVEELEWVVPHGMVWDRHGTPTPLASNPGVEADSYPRVINDAGLVAGTAWYGAPFGGHYEAARWPSPDVLEPLGLLPGGGYSDIYGQSEEGWGVGLADHIDPDAPEGYVDHSVLWTDDTEHIRVLPSPWAVTHGVEDWHEWIGGPAHGVHTGLDQVGTRAHLDNHEDGSVRFAPTLYLNASTCGELVPTTHEAYWDGVEDELALGTSSARVSSAEPAATPGSRPAAYRDLPRVGGAGAGEQDVTAHRR